MTADEKIEFITPVMKIFKQALEGLHIHIPVMVLCVHGSDADQTNILSEPNKVGEEYKKAIQQVCEKLGGVRDSPKSPSPSQPIETPSKPERKRLKCSNAPDITWPSSEKTNHSPTTPAPSKGATERSQTNGDQK